MTGKLAWPLEVFTDIADVGGSTMIVRSPGEIKGLVEKWSVDRPFPIEIDGKVVMQELETWMKDVGERLKEANVPFVQWFDVAIESLRQRFESFI